MSESFKEIIEQKYKGGVKSPEALSPSNSTENAAPAPKTRSFARAKTNFGASNPTTQVTDPSASSSTSPTSTENPSPRRAFAAAKTERKSYDELLKELEAEENKKQQQAKPSKLTEKKSELKTEAQPEPEPIIEKKEGYINYSIDDGKSYERAYFFFSATSLDFTISEDHDRDEPLGSFELNNAKVQTATRLTPPTTPRGGSKLSSSLRGESAPPSILMLSCEESQLGSMTVGKSQKYLLQFAQAEDAMEWMEAIIVQIGNCEEYVKQLPETNERVSNLLSDLDRDQLEELLKELVKEKRISFKVLKKMVE